MLARRRSTELHLGSKLAELGGVERSNLGLHCLRIAPLRKLALGGEVLDLGPKKTLRVDVDREALLVDVERVVLGLVNGDVKTRYGAREDPVILDERIKVVRNVTGAVGFSGEDHRHAHGFFIVLHAEVFDLP